MKVRCKDCANFLKDIRRCPFKKTKHSLSAGKKRDCESFKLISKKKESIPVRRAPLRRAPKTETRVTSQKKTEPVVEESKEVKIVEIAATSVSKDKKTLKDFLPWRKKKSTK